MPRKYKPNEHDFFCTGEQCHCTRTFWVVPGTVKKYEAKVTCEVCGKKLTWYLSIPAYKELMGLHVDTCDI